MDEGQEQLHPERVPDAESATADDEKFTAYLLNEDHPVGKSKAKFFKAAGFTPDNYGELRDQMLSQLPQVRGELKKANEGGGENYEAVVKVEAAGGRTLDVRTFWEVHPRKGTRLITAYPLS